MRLIDPDEIWFHEHPDRSSHIRKALPNESNPEFMSLGPHDRSRRHILIWKIPRDNLMAPGKLMKIPFLTFADEEIRDEDATLLPIINQTLMDAAREYGMKPPKGPQR